MNWYLMIICTVALTTQTTLEEKITSMVWKNRVIVVYSPTAQNEAYQRQKEWLDEVAKSLPERDLIVVDCVANDASKADVIYLTKRFNHRPDRFGVWLIGKDGGLKLQSEKSLRPQQFFDLIDTMPMRQAEMSKTKN